MHAVRDAFLLGLGYTGVSVHHVTPEVDAGPVVLQEVVPIEPGDDEVRLYHRIKTVEHRLLPQAVQLVLSSDTRLPDDREAGAIYTAGGVYA
jgi:phosphoribosylglycinamide formyltransferase-1